MHNIIWWIHIYNIYIHIYIFIYGHFLKNLAGLVSLAASGPGLQLQKGISKRWTPSWFFFHIIVSICWTIFFFLLFLDIFVEFKRYNMGLLQNIAGFGLSNTGWMPTRCIGSRYIPIDTFLCESLEALQNGVAATRNIRSSQAKKAVNMRPVAGPKYVTGLPGEFIEAIFWFQLVILPRVIERQRNQTNRLQGSRYYFRLNIIYMILYNFVDIYIYILRSLSIINRLLDSRSLEKSACLPKA